MRRPSIIFNNSCVFPVPFLPIKTDTRFRNNLSGSEIKRYLVSVLFCKQNRFERKAYCSIAYSYQRLGTEVAASAPKRHESTFLSQGPEMKVRGIQERQSRGINPFESQNHCVAEQTQSSNGTRKSQCLNDCVARFDIVEHRTKQGVCLGDINPISSSKNLR